jgi:hypothetical protein
LNRWVKDEDPRAKIFQGRVSRVIQVKDILQVFLDEDDDSDRAAALYLDNNLAEGFGVLLAVINNVNNGNEILDGWDLTLANKETAKSAAQQLAHLLDANPKIHQKLSNISAMGYV